MTEYADFKSEATAEYVKDQIKIKEEERQAAMGLISDSENKGGGALNKLITVADDRLQILLQGNYLDVEEADDLSAALDESARFGCETESIIQWVVIRCGVTQQMKSVREWGVTALTHLDIGGNKSDGGSKFGLKRKSGDDERPIG